MSWVDINYPVFFRNFVKNVEIFHETVNDEMNVWLVVHRLGDGKWYKLRRIFFWWWNNEIRKNEINKQINVISEQVNLMSETSKFNEWNNEISKQWNE